MCCATIRRWRRSIRSTAPAAPGGSQNVGRLFINLKPRGERPPMKQVVENLRKKMREVPGISVYMRPIQNLQLGGRPEQGAIPVHPAERAGGRAQRLGAAPAGADARRPDVPRRDERLAAEGPAGVAQDRPRPRQHARRLDRRDPHGALQRLRRAPGVDDLHAGRQLPGDHGSRARREAGRERVQQHLRAFFERRTGAAVELHDGAALDRPDLDQPRRPAAGGDGVVQPRSRHRARRRDGEDREVPRPAPHAGVDHHQLRRRRGGVQELAGQPGNPDRLGAARHLRPARRAVRELHPPADDPRRPAVGGGRRAADAAGSSTRT